MKYSAKRSFASNNINKRFWTRSFASRSYGRFAAHRYFMKNKNRDFVRQVPENGFTSEQMVFYKIEIEAPSQNAVSVLSGNDDK